MITVKKIKPTLHPCKAVEEYTDTRLESIQAFLLQMMMMMSMVFNVPPTAKVIRGRAILAKGIAEKKNLLTRVRIQQPILSLISSFSEKSVQSA